MPKQIAIIIVNWNSYDLTYDTLVSLSNTTYTNYDIIVVDNCSEDGSGDKLKENLFDICIHKIYKLFSEMIKLNLKLALQ